MGRRAIDHRLQIGRLHLVHRGVYAVGHAGLAREGRLMAAVLAGREGAVLSHRSAAALWGVGPDRGAAFEITVPVTRRARPGIVQHHSPIRPDELTTVMRIPVTTVPRTLLDLAAVVDRRQLRRAVDEAEVLRLWDAVSLAEVIERYPGRRGVAALRSVLADGMIGATVTRSELELRFLEFLASARLPAVQANVPLDLRGHRIEADFLWPHQHLIVELDGHATHATRAGFERDRERDRLLHTAGWRVIRITWRQLHDDPRAVAHDLRTLLAA
jgi:very-short-patch-repair endonuclease